MTNHNMICFCFCSYLILRWNIPQYCHQKDEIKDLYAKDDGFLTLQSVSCHPSSLLLAY